MSNLPGAHQKVISILQQIGTIMVSMMSVVNPECPIFDDAVVRYILVNNTRNGSEDVRSAEVNVSNSQIDTRRSSKLTLTAYNLPKSKVVTTTP